MPFYRKISAIILIFIFVLTLPFTAEAKTKRKKCTQWQPTGELAEIPFYNDCKRTNGDLAIATTNGIFWCPEFASKLESAYPGITHFYYVHEYAHYEVGSNEQAADCWAAKQLAETCYILIAINHFNDRGDEYIPGYGYMADRAKTIEKCANN